MMPKAMASNRLMDAGKGDCFFKSLLDTAFMQVMAPDFSGPWIFAQRSRWENKLPCPLAGSIGIFSGKRPREMDMTESAAAIVFMNCLDFYQMVFKGVENIQRQHRHPVLSALTVRNEDLVH